MVSVKPLPPAVALAGAIDVIVGTGLLIVNGVGPELPPPGAGLNTATGLGPADAMSLAGTVAVSCVLLTNVVVSGIPWIPNWTTDVVTKFVPLTVRVNDGPPAVALVGEIEVIDGKGLLIANVAVADAPPPGAGFVTVTLTVPPVAISAAVIAAVTCVALTNVVVFAAPLKLTTEVDTKFVPLTVSVNAAPPAGALVGNKVVIVGTGLLMVTVAAAEMPPPGAGFVTVTLNVAAVAISAASIAAVTCVALTNAVVFAAPLKFTTGFVNGAVVNFNGAAKTTAFVSATQVTAAILAADIATAATVNVTVTNPAPGGGTSAAATFTINNPLPTITTLSPTSATAGRCAIHLDVERPKLRVHCR